MLVRACVLTLGAIFPCAQMICALPAHSFLSALLPPFVQSTTAAANQFSSTAILPHPALAPISTIPPHLKSSSGEALLQHDVKHQAVQQQPQFSELSGLDEWQLLASSPASDLPQPACIGQASRHLVCSGGSRYAVAAYPSVADYSHADAVRAV
jgi:hypothetical protein